MAINIDRVVTTLTFTTSAMTAVTHTFGQSEVQGWAKTWKLTMPTFADTINPAGTLSILDPDGTELWNSGAKAQGSTTVITGGEIPFVGGESIKLVLTAAPSGAATVINVSATFALYFIPQ